MAKVSQNNALIALLLIIVGAVVVAFMLTKETPPVNNNEVEEPIENGSAQNFNFLKPEAWAYTENAVEDIQELTPGQVLQFGVVPSVSEQDIYYFATTAPDPKDAEKTLYSIYAYNGQDYTFERIYRLSLGDSAFPGMRPGLDVALHVIGQDGEKLAILAKDTDAELGPCTEPLTLGQSVTTQTYYSMLSLDLTDPFGKGLQPYEVPEDVYDQALERQNECAAN